MNLTLISNYLILQFFIVFKPLKFLSGIINSPDTSYYRLLRFYHDSNLSNSRTRVRNLVKFSLANQHCINVATFLSHTGATFKIAEISVNGTEAIKQSYGLERSPIRRKERFVEGGERGERSGYLHETLLNSRRGIEREHIGHKDLSHRPCIMACTFLYTQFLYFIGDVWTMHLSDESLLLVAFRVFVDRTWFAIFLSFFNSQFFQDRKLNSRCHQRKFYSSIE